VQWCRGGLVFKAHRLCVSHNSGLERNKEEDRVPEEEEDEGPEGEREADEHGVPERRHYGRVRPRLRHIAHLPEVEKGR